MRFKNGVVMWRMSPAIEDVLDHIDEVHRRVIGREAIITSARDGEHSASSLHYQGAAVDLRTVDLSPAKRAALRDALVHALGDTYDVVLESDHIHLEYDPE